MSATRRKIVIAVKNREPLGVEEASRREGIQSSFKKNRIPSVEKISGDGKMLGRPPRDAIQLPFQPYEVAGVPQVKIREVRDEHVAANLPYDAGRTTAAVHAQPPLTAFIPDAVTRGRPL